MQLSEKLGQTTGRRFKETDRENKPSRPSSSCRKGKAVEMDCFPIMVLLESVYPKNREIWEVPLLWRRRNIRVFFCPKWGKQVEEKSTSKRNWEKRLVPHMIEIRRKFNAIKQMLRGITVRNEVEEKVET